MSICFLKMETFFSSLKSSIKSLGKLLAKEEKLIFTFPDYSCIFHFGHNICEYLSICKEYGRNKFLDAAFLQLVGRKA